MAVEHFPSESCKCLELTKRARRILYRLDRSLRQTPGPLGRLSSIFNLLRTLTLGLSRSRCLRTSVRHPYKLVAGFRDNHLFTPTPHQPSTNNRRAKAV